MNKRLTFLLTALFAVTSLWAQPFQSGDLWYRVIGSGDDGNAVEVIRVDYSSLTDVTIPETVEYEGVKYSVTSIEDGAFSYCISLTSISIPETVTSIGEKVFARCTSLESIIVESGNSVFDSRDNCNAIIETESNTLILGCKNTVIPENVTSIGAGAFSDCSGLTSINIPGNVTSIGAGAFESCSGLISVNITNGVTNIGFLAFANCSSLTSIIIPESVTDINSSFRNCSNLESIKVANGNKVYDSREDCNAIIEKDPFGYHKLIRGCKNTIIPNGIYIIAGYAFFNCKGLTSIIIPESLNENYGVIGSYSFACCDDLEYIILKSATPPTLWYNSGLSNELPIYVPMESVAAYKSAPVWENMNIIGYDETGIDGIVSDNADMPTRKVLRDGKLIIRKAGKTYDLQGVEMK